MRRAGLAALVLALSLPGLATAKDPGRWRLTGRSTIPILYYQGMAVAPGGSLFFDGVEVGLYRTDGALKQKASTSDVIPPAVGALGFNHVGDITYDTREGGRVLLPMECYDSKLGNTCGRGEIGVADPKTLKWRYGVPLDKRDIPKAMWCELSPDGALLWTSAGNDLIAYRDADISRAHATGTPIRPVRRLRRAVPPSGITGAAFYDGRLFLAGSVGARFQVWSVDLTTGKRRLEIERTISGESEGLATVELAGGVLEWMIQPVGGSGPPTYKDSSLLSFRPAHVALRVRATPAHVAVGHRSRVVVRVAERPLARVHAVAGATVRIGAAVARTDAAGRAVLHVRPAHAGRLRVSARHAQDSGFTAIRAR
jgi:hypothetical protein